MFKSIVFIFLLFPFLANAEQSEEEAMDEVIGMMVVAKATGMCGVLSQLVRFQETTKMKGGDEFIMRFLNTEAARLGHTVESYIGQCPSVIEKYKGFMELIGFKE
ncbi:MAG: hypothetical protein QNK36_04750 [Colwellia sp.]|nr:hypothetical protein [Colwellia sp.]